MWAPGTRRRATSIRGEPASVTCPAVTVTTPELPYSTRSGCQPVRATASRLEAFTASRPGGPAEMSLSLSL